MKKSRYTDRQIIGILKQAEAGMAVPALCREYVHWIRLLSGVVSLGNYVVTMGLNISVQH